jgi:UDP-N-acetylglucosamine--N-acetylmuramyl-(pentapeptide) pyrophosphoryl-undecaprenol N-acetylglucosamine transferase
VLGANREAGRAAFGAVSGDVLVLVFGGSRGARHLNSAFINLYQRLSKFGNVRVIQIAGPKEAATVRKALAEVAGGSAPPWWDVREYVDGMGDLIAASDVVVCRAGATTLAELSVLAKPMVLVPYPYATDYHQTGNARPFLQAGGAEVVADAMLDGDSFASAVMGLVSDPARRAEMARNAGGLGRPDAAEAVVAVIHAAASGRQSAGNAVRTEEGTGTS